MTSRLVWSQVRVGRWSPPPCGCSDPQASHSYHGLDTPSNSLASCSRSQRLWVDGGAQPPLHESYAERRYTRVAMSPLYCQISHNCYVTPIDHAFDAWCSVLIEKGQGPWNFFSWQNISIFENIIIAIFGKNVEVNLIKKYIKRHKVCQYIFNDQKLIKIESFNLRIY